MANPRSQIDMNEKPRKSSRTPQNSAIKQVIKQTSVFQPWPLMLIPIIVRAGGTIPLVSVSDETVIVSYFWYFSIAGNPKKIKRTEKSAIWRKTFRAEANFVILFGWCTFSKTYHDWTPDLTFVIKYQTMNVPHLCWLLLGKPSRIDTKDFVNLWPHLPLFELSWNQFWPTQ